MNKFVMSLALALSLVSARGEASDFDPQLAHALEGTYAAVGCTYIGKGQSECGAVTQVAFKVLRSGGDPFLSMAITGPGGVGGVGYFALRSDTLIYGQGQHPSLSHDEVEYLRPTAGTGLVLASRREVSSFNQGGSFRSNVSIEAKGADVVVTFDATASSQLGGSDTRHYTYVIFGTRRR